jgi:hypothetical protein
MPTQQPNWRAAVEYAAAKGLEKLTQALDERGCLPLLKDQEKVVKAAIWGACKGSLVWAGEVAGMGSDVRQAADPETWSDEPQVKGHMADILQIGDKRKCTLCKTPLVMGYYDTPLGDLCDQCLDKNYPDDEQ